ncbi:MAG: hypothetical protein H6739_04015 [Alphaproteobacteria bacterium]|nr:hypothetical protein [Alphaproteobacteria bacterium]
MSAGAPAWPRLAAAQVAALGLTALIAWTLRPAEGPPPPPAPEVVAAALPVLAARAETTERTLGAALPPQAEASTAGFVALQAQAAGLSLGDLGWSLRPRQGPLVPVELRVTARGDPLNVPILVDGLFRQSRPVLVTRLTLHRESDTTAWLGLQARFFRPTAPDPTWPEAAAARAWGDPGPDLAEALGEAARLALLDAFTAHLPRMEAASAANRRAVMRALPAVIRAIDAGERVEATLELRDGALLVR